MGLGDIVEESSSNASGSSSGGNSSGSSSGYPKFERKHPAYSIEYYEDGSKAFKSYPDTAPLTYKQKSKNSSKKLESKAPELKKFWMDEQQFEMVCRRVEKHFGVDLLETLQEGRIEKAVELITKAAKKTNDAAPTKKARLNRNCSVCDNTINLRYGDYEKIDEHVVCDRHNVTELKEAGVI